MLRRHAGDAGAQDRDARQERYLQAKKIALAAAELPAEDQGCLIAAECGGDAALEAEVRWQLEAIGTTTSTDFLADGPEAPDSTGSSVAAASHTDYRIQRRLGEGGMGVVYLAERVVDGIRQRVALKFLNLAGHPTHESLLRFVEERRILATLSHPNIAYLIDGGCTTDGRPYLALEYVEGLRIDRWCEQRRCGLRERVELFLKVCAAVQYAHTQLVIHRDIKPANILVTEQGEPKLLDFGIARLLDRVDGEAEMRTATVQRALTMAYASPEQLLGRTLGTAADVWSLGVVLYQLVCGVLPFNAVAAETPLALHHRIMSGRLVPPSARARQAGQGAMPVSTDIDAIVAKALRRDPAERYGSVEALAADLRHFLAARPVRARQGERWYRLRLFLRRNRLGVGVAALMLLMLAAFVAERERQLYRLEFERDKTQAVVGFMRELFEHADADHSHGNRTTVREVLDHGVALLQARPDMAPAVRAALLLSIGKAYVALDMGGQAIPPLREAAALLARSRAEPLERGRVMAALGQAYAVVIDLPAAAAADDEAIRLLEQAPGQHADEILRARINRYYGDIGTLDRPLAQSIAELSRIVAELRGRPSPNRELEAQALAGIAVAQAAAGDGAAALDAARESLALASRQFGAADPALLYFRFVQALATMRGDPADAVAQFQRSIADYDHLVGAPGPGLAGLLAYFGRSLAQLGRHRDAAQALERARTIAESFAADSPDFYLGILVTLAQQYVELDRSAEALTLLQPPREQLAARVVGGSAWAIANQAGALEVFGTVALERGRAQAALGDFEQARALLGERERELSPELYAASLAGLGDAALAQGRLGQAGQALDALEAFNRGRRAAPEDGPELDAALLRGRLALARGDLASAADVAGPAAALAAQRWGPCGRRAKAFAALEAQVQEKPGKGAGCAPVP